MNDSRPDHSNCPASIRATLLEDAKDLEAFKEREHEPVINFEAFVASLKTRSGESPAEADDPLGLF